MSALALPRPTVSHDLEAFAEIVEEAARTVDHLYETGRFKAAEHLDALVAEAEELLEDNGDAEENGDRENDELSEVDESGAHERPTEFPECETHDDDLDFAYERGPYDPDRRARFHDDTDTDLDFLFSAEPPAAAGGAGSRR
ncbi:MAG: hypothetical protein ABIT01_20360 [Thermoanaerobaculia bacterium]